MTETVKDRIEKQRAGGGSKLEKGELKQRKERGHSQVCLLDLILIAIDVSFGCCDCVVTYPLPVLHVRFDLK